MIPNGHGVLPAPAGSGSPAAAAGLRGFAGPAPRPGAGLRRFTAPPPPPPAAQEQCELCGEKLGGEHRHLADPQRHSIACACTACALLFTRPGARYRTIPDRVCHDPRAPLTDAEWAELQIPVAIAFFFVSSALARVVASYPSPAGVTECELDLAAWDRLAAGHPLLAAVEPDVEAILVSHGDGTEAFLIPIDMCYSLAGTLRLNWHGFDGGTEVRRILADCLTDLRQRAREI